MSSGVGVGRVPRERVMPGVGVCAAALTLYVRTPHCVRSMMADPHQEHVSFVRSLLDTVPPRSPYLCMSAVRSVQSFVGDTREVLEAAVDSIDFASVLLMHMDTLRSSYNMHLKDLKRSYFILERNQPRIEHDECVSVRWEMGWKLVCCEGRLPLKCKCENIRVCSKCTCRCELCNEPVCDACGDDRWLEGSVLCKWCIDNLEEESSE